MVAPLVGAAALYAGAGLFESLFGQGDPNQRFRDKRNEFALAGRGKDTINFADLLARNASNTNDFATKYGEGVDRDFGIDTGRGRRELLSLGLKDKNRFLTEKYPQLLLANERIKQGYNAQLG